MNLPSLSLNNQSILLFLQKHRSLIAICIIMLIILAVGLIVISFLNNNVLTMKDVTGETKELKVNTRLYYEVKEGMQQNASRPVSGIDNLRNPFYQE